MARGSKKVAGSDEMPLEGGWHRPIGYADAQWRPPRIEDLPASWAGVKRLAFDTETYDPHINTLGPGVRRGSRMIGVSFAIEYGPAFYLPFFHGYDPVSNPYPDAALYDNMDPEVVLAYLRDNFKTYEGEVVGMNLPYDLDHVWEEGITMPKVSRFLDIGVADPLLNELHDKYSMQAISKRRGFEGKDEVTLNQAATANKWHPKGDLHKMPARFAGEYGTEDSALPLKVLRLQEQDIEKNGLEKSWDMECRLLPILVRMTRRGVAVDERRLEQVEEWSKKVERGALAIVKHETGVDIDLNNDRNTELLHRAMTAAGIDTSRGIKREVFGPLKDNATAQALDKMKQMQTLRSTFVNGTRNHLVNGRMHCVFNQIRRTNDDSNGEDSGVAFGRLSTEHVNMQNQPSLSRSPPNDETGAIWRSIYGPDLGMMWAAKDLKQQEPRWTYQFAAMAKLPGADKVVQALRDNPLMDSYQVLVDITGLGRGTCKIAWLSYVYGKSDGNLCGTPPPFGFGLPTWPAVYDRRSWQHVSIETPRGAELVAAGASPYRRPGPEGQAIIDKINEGAPFLRALQKMAQKRATERGYVQLISGRRCHFEKYEDSGKYKDVHAALNRIIQGSAAEQTKGMMIAVSEAGFDDSLLLQVHDELDSQVESKKQAEQIVEVMRHAVPMMFETVVDLELGPSWGESMGVEYNEQGKLGANTKRVFNWDRWKEEESV